MRKNKRKKMLGSGIAERRMSMCPPLLACMLLCSPVGQVCGQDGVRASGSLSGGMEQAVRVAESVPAVQQVRQITIHGTVVDSQGNPLTGATIRSVSGGG